MRGIVILCLLGFTSCAGAHYPVKPITSEDAKINSDNVIKEQVFEPEAKSGKSMLETVPSPANVVTDEKKEEVENVTWQMPRWCEYLEQKSNQIQVCGVALHGNFQASRTRSENDARKQLARRECSQVDETIKETNDGSGSEQNSNSNLRSKCELKPYVIEIQKTVESEGKYLTFTKLVQYFE